MKMRLDDIINGIKGFVTMLFLIPSLPVEQATCLTRNPHHMASANKHITLFSHRYRSDSTYELPDYSNKEYNEM